MSGQSWEPLAVACRAFLAAYDHRWDADALVLGSLAADVRAGLAVVPRAEPTRAGRSPGGQATQPAVSEADCLAAACPRCGAGAGAPCATATGGPITGGARFHADRWAAARRVA